MIALNPLLTHLNRIRVLQGSLQKILNIKSDGKELHFAIVYIFFFSAMEEGKNLAVHIYTHTRKNDILVLLLMLSTSRFLLLLLLLLLRHKIFGKREINEYQN